MAGMDEKDKVEEEGVVRWERFLPRESVRVLLVEPDDSTREIVAALLRKCAYKVVVASDGLKAWETIKERTHDIDLILTEVELPIISGFDLLTLITEHEACKRIPVIMMSSQDSMNVVFKCMLKGAADFLVKPIRKNELRNLWQHFWRRCISNDESAGIVVSHDVNLAPQKFEDDSDEHAASNHSSENLDCIERKRDCSDKGSDTQNSCTRPCMEAQCTSIQNIQEKDRMNMTTISTNSKIRIHGGLGCTNLKEIVPLHDDSKGKSIEVGPELTPCSIGSEQAMFKKKNADDGVNNHNSITPTGMSSSCQTDGTGFDQVEPSTKTEDLLKAMDCKKGNENEPFFGDSISKDSRTLVHNDQLELSLRRYQPKSYNVTQNDGCSKLSHSNSSAFSLYCGRTDQRKNSSRSASGDVRVEREDGFDYTQQYHLNVYPHHPTCDLPEASESTVISSLSQGGKTVQGLDKNTPFLDSNVTCDSLPTGFGFSLQPWISTELGAPPWSKSPTVQKAIPVKLSKQSHVEILNLDQFYDSHDQSNIMEGYQSQNEQVQIVEPTEDPRNLSSTADHSDNSICIGIGDHPNSNGFENVCKGYKDNLAVENVIRMTGETQLDNKLLNQEGTLLPRSHRSIEREAALTKFRLKRKDRCFEKKVRYHSRQKLAEQRPRVKGQFVRQVQLDPKSVQGEHQSEAMTT